MSKKKPPILPLYIKKESPARPSSSDYIKVFIGMNRRHSNSNLRKRCHESKQEYEDSKKYVKQKP